MSDYFITFFDYCQADTIKIYVSRRENDVKFIIFQQKDKYSFLYCIL